MTKLEILLQTVSSHRLTSHSKEVIALDKLFENIVANGNEEDIKQSLELVEKYFNMAESEPSEFLKAA